MNIKDLKGAVKSLSKKMTLETPQVVRKTLDQTINRHFKKYLPPT